MSYFPILITGSLRFLVLLLLLLLMAVVDSGKSGRLNGRLFAELSLLLLIPAVMIWFRSFLTLLLLALLFWSEIHGITSFLKVKVFGGGGGGIGGGGGSGGAAAAGADQDDVGVDFEAICAIEGAFISVAGAIVIAGALVIAGAIVISGAVTALIDCTGGGGGGRKVAEGRRRVKYWCFC